MDFESVLPEGQAMQNYHSPTHPTSAGMVEMRKAAAVDSLELELQRQFVQSQCQALARRHPAEQIFLVHALAEFHAEAVVLAKEGLWDRATAQLDALDRMTLPDDAELRAVVESTGLPARALLNWLQGDGELAITQLEHALGHCRTLAEVHGHAHLGARRIHLAANRARVLVAMGRIDEGLQAVAALEAVLDGDAGCWPHGGGDSLGLPLSGPARFGLGQQLARIAALAGRGDAKVEGARAPPAGATASICWHGP